MKSKYKPKNKQIFTYIFNFSLITILIIIGFFGVFSYDSVKAIVEFNIYLPLIMKAEPTPEPEGVYILPNHTSHVSSIDYLVIYGEVMNNTNFNLRFVRIHANVFNSNGQLLDTDYTYTRLDNVPAGDKACFRMSHPAPEGWAYYEFEPVSYKTDGEPLPNLLVFNLSGRYKTTTGSYEIIGQITNNHGSKVSWVRPVGTLYNASNQVVGCDFTYVNGTDLEAGETSSFKMTTTGRDYSDVTNYTIQIDGNPE